MIISRRRKLTREPTVALINIVFLILIFFMVAGTLARTPDSSIEYVSSADLECCAPADVLSITEDGDLSFNGDRYVSVSEFLTNHRPGQEGLGVMPDRRLSAKGLLDIVNQLRVGGAKQIRLVVEQK